MRCCCAARAHALEVDLSAVGPSIFGQMYACRLTPACGPMLACGPAQVAICPKHFFKDIAFYLLALGTVLYCLAVGEVRVPHAEQQLPQHACERRAF